MNSTTNEKLRTGALAQDKQRGITALDYGVPPQPEVHFHGDLV